MTPTEVNRFEKIYQNHLRLLKLQDKSQKPLMPVPGQFVASWTKFHTISDILTPAEIELLTGATRKLRYRVLPTATWTGHAIAP